jgi:hypothetical protein
VTTGTGSWLVKGERSDLTLGAEPKVRREASGGAAHVLDGLTGVPRLQVLGEVAGTPTVKVIKNTNADASTILGWRFTVNAGDDIVAGARLAEDGIDCGFVQPGDVAAIGVLPGVAVTIHAVCVANVAYANAAGTILPTGTTEANTRTAMTRFEFEAGTRVVTLEASSSYIISSVTYAMLMARGHVDG